MHASQIEKATKAEATAAKKESGSKNPGRGKSLKKPLHKMSVQNAKQKGDTRCATE